MDVILARSVVIATAYAFCPPAGADEIATLGASKAIRVGKKLGWNVTKKKVGRTDYVTFHKMGRIVGLHLLLCK